MCRQNCSTLVCVTKNLFIASLVFVLQACTSSGQDRTADARVAAQRSVGNIPITWQSGQQSVGEVQVSWLKRIDDAVLSDLVAEAQQNNANLQSARANVDNARALSRQASASLFPQVGMSAELNQTGTRQNSAPSNINLGLQASWEVDVWGRLSNSSQAGYQSLVAAEADYKFAQYSIAANVTHAYLATIEAAQQLAVAEASIDALQRTNEIVRLQYENGSAGQQSLSLARSDLASAQDSYAASQGALRNAQRALELLLGRYPAAELKVKTSLPANPGAVPAGLPSELLERRPDLVAAERRIAAAFNQTDAAKAARLPSLSLTGAIGGASSSLGSLLDPANVAWQAAVSLLAPLFDGGLRKAQVDSATANQNAAIAGYRQAALTAFGEVETALDQNQILDHRSKSLKVALDSAEEALRIAELQFQEGEISLVDVLTIQQRVFTARRNALAIERAKLSQWVDLNLALGGSWE